MLQASVVLLRHSPGSASRGVSFSMGRLLTCKGHRWLASQPYKANRSSAIGHARTQQQGQYSAMNDPTGTVEEPASGAGGDADDVGPRDCHPLGVDVSSVQLR